MAHRAFQIDAYGRPTYVLADKSMGPCDICENSDGIYFINIGKIGTSFHDWGIVCADCLNASIKNPHNDLECSICHKTFEWYVDGTRHICRDYDLGLDRDDLVEHFTLVQQCETYPDLAQWCAGNLPGSSVHLLDGEVIIHTGLTVEMNGELLPIEDLGEEA